MDFLPLCITMLMKRAMVSLPCLGSGRTERWGVEPLRDMGLISWGRAEARRSHRVTGLARLRGSGQDFGRFAPYLERACLRLATPAASSEPRTVW